MTPPLPAWPYFVDDFPVSLYKGGVKNPTPIPLHVIIDNTGSEPEPCAFAYSRHHAKQIAIALSNHYEHSRGRGLEG